MTRSTPASVAALFALTLFAQSTLLTPGTELVYESGGRETPWRVDSAEHGMSLGGKSGCSRVRFAAGGPRAGIDIRVTCATDGMLFAWDSSASAWRESRPLRVGGTLESRTATSRSTYAVTAEAVQVLSGFALRVLETSVTTRDSAGRVTRRLRESFAPQLGTAVWGIFEVPDSAGTGWRTQQEFRLIAIRRAPR